MAETIVNEKRLSHDYVENVENVLEASDKEKSQGDDFFAGIVENEHDSEVPPGYWTSFEFLGSCVAIVLLANCLFIGYLMPVRILMIFKATLTT